MQGNCTISGTFDGEAFEADLVVSYVDGGIIGDYEVCHFEATFDNVAFSDETTSVVPLFTGVECDHIEDELHIHTWDGDITFGHSRYFLPGYMLIEVRRHTMTNQLSAKLTFQTTWYNWTWKHFGGTYNLRFELPSSACEVTDTFATLAAAPYYFRNANVDQIIQYPEFNTDWIDIDDCSEILTWTDVESDISLSTTATYTVQTLTDLDACGTSPSPTGHEPLFYLYTSTDTDCTFGNYENFKLYFPEWTWLGYYRTDAVSGTKLLTLNIVACP